MADAFVTLIGIQPSASVQIERDAERDQMSQPRSSGVMKENLYVTRRKRGVSRSTEAGGIPAPAISAPAEGLTFGIGLLLAPGVGAPVDATNFAVGVLYGPVVTSPVEDTQYAVGQLFAPRISAPTDPTTFGVGVLFAPIIDAPIDGSTY